MIPDSVLNRLQHLVRVYEFSTFFEETARLAADLMEADGAAFIVHEDHNLRYLFFHGLPTSYSELSKHVFPDDRGNSGAVLRTDRAIYVPDYPHSAHAMPEYVATGLQASLALPVHGPQGASGILAVAWFRPAPAELAESTLHLAQLLADMLGAAWYRMGIELHLEQIATQDTLTGVPNRYQLEERLNIACARALRDQRILAIVLLDIDGFKEVNDSLGHRAGDRLLREIVTRLHDVLRASDTIVRLAGDEFILLLEKLHSPRDLEDVLQRILLALNIRIGVDNHRFCDDLRRALAGCPALPTERICLELVERIALRDIAKTTRLISDCQSLGVRFALDDFGTGPAALQYLLELGCNQIKIDHSFVIPMTGSQRHQRMIQAMIQMAHALGVTVTAEGIENMESAELLRQMRADRGQGYGIAMPMPASDFATYWLQHTAAEQPAT